MNIYYLGSSVWGNNPCHPILILHLISGTTGGNSIANFGTVDEGLIFGAEYGSIKESIVYMNERKESGWINQEEYKESPCREWIPMVRTFVGEEHGH